MFSTAHRVWPAKFDLVSKLLVVCVICVVAGRRDDVEDSASRSRTANKPSVSPDNSVHSIFSTLHVCQV